MVGLSIPRHARTDTQTTRSTAPAMLALALIGAAVVVRSIGRGASRRERPLLRRKSDIFDQAAGDIADAIGSIDESARIILHTIALQAQALTGS